MCPELDDETLVAAAQRGDDGALNALLRRHYDRIWGICRRLAGNDADAADATQEALIAISKGLPKFTGAASFSTWSYRVASNACLDELRRRGRRPTPSMVDEHEGWAEGQLASTTPLLAERLADRLMLDDAIASLPEEFRVCIVLRQHVGLDYAEIADVLEIPIGTVRSRLARARTRLVATLTEASADGTNPDQPGNQTTLDHRPNQRP